MAPTRPRYVTDEEVRTHHPQLWRTELKEDIDDPHDRDILGPHDWDRAMTNQYGELWLRHPHRRRKVSN